MITDFNKCHECGQEFCYCGEINEANRVDEGYDDSMDEDDRIEQEQENLLQTALECHCGAYKVMPNGTVYHVADCCC